PGTRRPSMTFIYDLVFDAAPATVDTSYLPRLRKAARSAIQHSTLIGVISESVEHELNARYPETVGRTVLIRPGPTTFPQVTAATSARVLGAHGLTPGYLLHVGTLEPRKNLARLVRAIASLPAPLVADRPLVLVGPDGWASRDLEVALEAVPGRWRRIPFVDDAELRVLYDHAAVAVTPSIYEGFGLPLLEAMSLGVPVACSAIPVFEEVAQGSAATFDPTDQDSIADTLERLLSDGDRLAVLGEAGRRRAEAFDWDTSADALLDAVAGLARERAPAA
ncbi:MAG: glycosyltransferase family 4 protein, partial [Actinomycetota bacterium]|nr:glycosyltransferase family 4 protein [Actinomycetota bacterium]